FIMTFSLAQEARRSSICRPLRQLYLFEVQTRRVEVQIDRELIGPGLGVVELPRAVAPLFVVATAIEDEPQTNAVQTAKCVEEFVQRRCVALKAQPRAEIRRPVADNAVDKFKALVLDNLTDGRGSGRVVIFREINVPSDPDTQGQGRGGHENKEDKQVSGLHTQLTRAGGVY